MGLKPTLGSYQCTDGIKPMGADKIQGAIVDRDKVQGLSLVTRQNQEEEPMRQEENKENVNASVGKRLCA